ncbi:MAG: hypothetical protein U9P44_03960 [archaeon]|nr:hypothetical protein [archaeon]
MMKILSRKYPALEKELEKGNILVLVNSEAGCDKGKRFRDSDIVEFAPVIAGG